MLLTETIGASINGNAIWLRIIQSMLGSLVLSYEHCVYLRSMPWGSIILISCLIVSWDIHSVDRHLYIYICPLLAGLPTQIQPKKMFLQAVYSLFDFDICLDASSWDKGVKRLSFHKFILLLLWVLVLLAEIVVVSRIRNSTCCSFSSSNNSSSSNSIRSSNMSSIHNSSGRKGSSSNISGINSSSIRNI